MHSNLSINNYTSPLDKIVRKKMKYKEELLLHFPLLTCRNEICISI